MHKRVALIGLFVIVIAALLIDGAVVNAQNLLINGFNVAYGGRTFDAASNATTFTYVVSGTDAPPDLSHFDIALPFCAPTLVVVSFSPADAVSFGTDPTTGLSGIKWDLPLLTTETRTYAITFEGYVGEGMVQVAVKGGDGFEVGSLPGPACVVPSIDVEKLVSIDGGAAWDDADAAPGPTLDPGGQVWFKFVVANDGDVPLSALSLSDSAVDVSACALTDPLAPDAWFECVVGPLAAVAGQHANTATASGAFEGAPVSDADDAHYFGGAPTPTATPTSTPTPPPTPAAPPPTGGQCPLSQGFWKNHPNDWSITSLTLGGQTYTQAEVLTILHTPPSGDASLILAHQLIAAKLNAENGADMAPAAAFIAQGDALLSGYGGKLPYGVAPSSGDGQAMVSAGGALDSFNNGQLTTNCWTTPPVVIEGPVTLIEANIIVINDVRIWLEPGDPILAILKIGDVLRVEGYYADRDGVIVLVAVKVTLIGPTVIEGPIMVIEGNVIVINGVRIWLAPNDPLLIHRGAVIIVVAVIVVFADVDIYVSDDDFDLTIYLDADGDWNCKNPPPAWAPAHGWRRKCGGDAIIIREKDHDDDDDRDDD